jgi:subfamily B ATP-binding cassette protein MsbA
LVCSSLVAFFTSLRQPYQPIMDKLFNNGPGGPQKARLMDALFRTLGIGEAQFVRFLPLLVLVVIFGKGLFTFFSSYLMKAVGHRVVKRLRDDLFSHLIHQSNSFFDRMPTGDLMSRLTNDVDKIHQAISGSMADFIEELFILLALLVGVFVIDVRLAVVSFVIRPGGHSPGPFQPPARRKASSARKSVPNLYLSMSHHGQQDHQAFTSEFEMRKFSRPRPGLRPTETRLVSLSSPFWNSSRRAWSLHPLCGHRRIAGRHQPERSAPSSWPSS